MNKEWLLNFKLKQITPMIHFQYDETGASIRATELKPKLDRFIIDLLNVPQEYLVKVFSSEVCSNLKKLKECTELSVIQEEMKKTNSNGRSEEKRTLTKDRMWLWDDRAKKATKAGEYDIALNYKIRIQAKDDKKELFPVRENNGSRKRIEDIGANFTISNKDVPENGRSSFYNNIEVKIMCFNIDLRGIINEVFPIFIASTNFGFRQNKGYGVFEVQDSERREKQLNKLRKLYPNRYELYKININQRTVGSKGQTQKSEYYKVALNTIKDFNQHLKSGFNFNRKGQYDNSRYDASYILKKYPEHMSKSFINEKKAMKQALSTNKNIDISVLKKSTNDDLAECEGPYWYMRGLLGFADHYEFRGLKLNGEEEAEFSVDFSVKSDELKRFASPMTFSIDCEYRTIYMLVDVESIEKLQDRKEKVTIAPIIKGKITGAKGRKLTDNERKHLEKKFENELEQIDSKELYIPSKEEFNARSFFETLVDDTQKAMIQGRVNYIRGMKYKVERVSK